MADLIYASSSHQNLESIEMNFIKLATAAAIGSTFLASSAMAASISFTGTVGTTTTDWNLPISPSIPQFDGSLGTLTSVDVKLDGTVSGDAKGESLDASDSVVTLDLRAEISINVGTATNLLQATAVASETFNASAFDGTIDFLGTSGATFEDITGTDTVMVTYTAADAAFADFAGGGDVAINCVGEGDSQGSGAGNLITQFNTDAECSVMVTYNFDANDPVASAPTPLALIGLSLVGLLLGARRRA